MPNMVYLRNQILKEADGSPYWINPGSNKIYYDVRGVFWWDFLKWDMAEFVAKCPNFKQVKTVQQKLGDLLEEIKGPISK